MGVPPDAGIVEFFDAVGQFFSRFGQVGLLSLLLGLLCFGAYLTLRARAWFNVLRAAYPGERIEFRRIWGAYVAAYGFNNVIPARGGDVIKLFLAKTSIPGSSYPAIAASLVVEAVFDATIGVFILTFAFTQGVFPKPPDFASLGAFDLSFFASHPRFLLFLLTALAVGALVAFALFSRRVRGVLGAGAPGARHPPRPPALRARGLARAVRGLALPLRRLLEPPRRLQHRRLGPQRAARPRGERRRVRRALHARRRGGAAGLPRQGLRGHRGGEHGRLLLGGPADRDRGVQPRRSASSRS